MTSATFRVLGIVLVSTLLLVPPAAVAQEEPAPAVAAAEREFGMDLSPYMLLNFGEYDWGLGVGAQFAWPVLPKGFIPNPRFPDAFYIEGGLDFYYWSWDYTVGAQDYDWSVVGLVPQAGVRWTVYVTETFAPFAAFKLGLGMAFVSGDLVTDDSDTDFYWSSTVGCLWDFSEIMSLRAEIGYGRYDDVIRIGLLIRL